MPRGNKDNLVPLQNRTTEEQRKIAKSGGVASGVARRKKADLRKAMQEAMEATFTDKNGNKKTGQEIAIAGIIANLSDPSGRNWGKAFEMMAMLTGQSMTKDQVAKIKAETALTKAKTKALEQDGGSMADIEDLTPLADMLRGGESEDVNDTDN